MPTHLAADDVRPRLVLEVGPGLAREYRVLELLQVRRSRVQQTGARGRHGVSGEVASQLGPEDESQHCLRRARTKRQQKSNQLKASHNS